MKATSNRTILKLVQEEYRNAAGLEIPESARRRSIIGAVISTTHPELSVNDRVVFDWGFATIHPSNPSILFVKNDGILAVQAGI